MRIIETYLRWEEKKPQPGNGVAETPEAEDQELNSSDEYWYICGQCGQRIAQNSARTAIQGQHHHVFSNPSGIVFEIACFSTASGFSFSGEYSTDFAWFSGYAWRIVICSSCLTHLGWLFSGAGAGHFFGFITDRVVAQDMSPGKS